jgi:hypothetical protein
MTKMLLPQKSMQIENKPRLAGARVIKMLCWKKEPILFLSVRLWGGQFRTKYQHTWNSDRLQND